MNDPEIRQLLMPHLAGGLIIDELPLGNRIGQMTRADLVHITPDLMHGYELKGDGDTLKRVPLQLACYGAVFDRVTFVVTAKHGRRIELPEWAGLAIIYEGRLDFMIEAKPVPTLDRDQLAVLLWQKELLEFLGRYGIKPLSRHRIWECRDMLDNPAIPLSDLRTYVRERLTKRYAAGCRLRDKRALQLA